MLSGGLRTKNIIKQSQENMPLVTVITVVRNGEKTFEKTILSVINQTYTNIEYIIVDGASTDGTLDIIKKYEDRVDYWMSESDKGIYDAMNKGIDFTAGEWILFLGADDLLLETFSTVCLKLRNKRTIYYADAFFPVNNIIGFGCFNKFKLAKHNICHQTIFYPKSCLSDAKFDLDYKILADYKRNIELYGDKTYNFEYIKEVIAVFSQQGVSDKIVDEVFLRNKFLLTKKNLGLLPAFYALLINYLRPIYHFILK